MIRESANARLGSRWPASWTRRPSSPASATVNDARRPVRVLHDALLPLGAEADRRAALQVDPVPLLLAHEVEGVVVVDVAVLEDLDESRAAVPSGRAEHLGQPLLVRVDRARDERRLGSDRNRQRVERVVERPHRRRLRHLAELGGRRVLPLRQTVDLVVEEQDLEVDVPPQRVDQVVAADRERVTVSGHDPDGQVRPGDRQPGRDRRRAPVDRVHPVGLHVVREARGTADPGDEDDPLAREPELGHEALDHVQDRVVAAARAPAHLLVGLEVLRLELRQSVRVVHFPLRRRQSRHLRSLEPPSSLRLMSPPAR